MIGVRDTLTLSYTKLRAKRILLIITVVVSGLLFGILSGGVLIATGVSNSITRYFDAALNGHYQVVVSPNIPDTIAYPQIDGMGDAIPANTLARLNVLQSEYTNQQKALAKKHGIEFDPTTITPILKSDPFNRKEANGDIRKVVDTSSPVYATYVHELQQEYVKTAPTTRTHLKQLAAHYGGTDFYVPQLAKGLMQNTAYLPDGKENLKKVGENPSESSNDYIADSVKLSTYIFANQATIGRFVLPENDKRAQSPTAIPVVLASSTIVKTFGKQLGISKKPTDPHAQVAWMQDLQQKVNGLTYQVCWRSQGDITLVQNTMRANTDIADNAKKKDYSPPLLQYDLPSTPCGAVTVKQDKRPAEQKKIDTSTIAMQQELGTYQSLERQLFTFQIVGVVTTTTGFEQPSDVPSFLSSLFGMQAASGAFIPQWLYDKLPASAQHKDILTKTDGQIQMDTSIFEKADIGETVVSFSSIESARRFIGSVCQYAGSDCKKDFAATPYGVNYLLIDTLSTTITDAARVALPIALAVATIVIWITMARVIIDSRRETAVFRALGAKRRDIASIYLTYSLLVALLIIIFMFVLGGILALIVDNRYGGLATDIAKVAYGSFTSTNAFHFIDVNLLLLAGLALCVIIISLIAVLPPLLRNIRRSPIRDMRDE